MARRFTVLTATTGDAPAGGPTGRPPELDDLTLERAQRREEPACRALVQRYQTQVFQTLGRVLGARRPRGLAGVTIADLAQETFLRVFRQLPTFDTRGTARLSTWIVTIATRAAIDELRRRCPEILSDDQAGVPLVARGRADE